MNRCDECKHKDSCVCVPYGCECFELDLEEHDKQIRADAINEIKKFVNKNIHFSYASEQRAFYKFCEQMKKGAENE